MNVQSLQGQNSCLLSFKIIYCYELRCHLCSAQVSFKWSTGLVHWGTTVTAAGVLRAGVVLVPTGQREFPTLQTHYHFLQLITVSYATLPKIHIFKMLPDRLPKLRLFSLSSFRYILLSVFPCTLVVAKFVARAFLEETCSEKSRRQSRSPESSQGGTALLSVNTLCCGSGICGFFFPFPEELHWGWWGTD